MKLKSITIGGFKNLQKTRIELQKIVSIVSSNNYGKSNLLEAIDFGTTFLSANEKDRKSMMRWVSGIPINKTLANENFFFEIEFVTDFEDDYKYVKYGFTFAWYKDDGSGQRITDEWIEARPNESVKYTSFLKRTEGKYRKEKNTSSFRKIRLDDCQLAIDMIALLEELPIQPFVKAIKRIDYRVCSSLDLGDRFQPNFIDYITDDNDGEIAFDDKDVPRAIYRLSQMDSEKYDLFLEAVYTLFPDFLDVSIEQYAVKTSGDSSLQMVLSAGDDDDSPKTEMEKIPFKIKDEIYRVFIKSKYINQPINITRMSTGTKRIFWLLANVFIASSLKMSFVGIEELETSIHPKLLKNLLEFLDEVLDDTSLIISSHSPFLIQYIKPEKIYIGVPSHDGTAVFKKIKGVRIKQLLNLARDHNMSLGEYVFELLSGDSDDEDILSFYLEG